MNTLQHFLPELEVDKTQIEDALRAVLHTILFNRSLGPVVPTEKNMLSFDNITYVSCGIPKVEENVDKAISKFCSNLQLVGPGLGGGQLWVSFYERREKKAFFGIHANKEKLYWERWIIPVVVNLSPHNIKSNSTVNDKEKETNYCSSSKSKILEYEKRRKNEMAEKVLRNTLFQIVKSVNGNNSNHIPPVNLNSENAMVFHYEISAPSEFTSNGRGSDNWIQKVILNGPNKINLMSI
eukprot:CAMPEP_0204840606 /NCGR_PEP_ID=MMETSP1346-20131115/38307_1 /ASSEMBLY_ACC=CAM_ASM_000771 /TAXON_ID=215587 /ORGANISM="Aplanochytrium stocchinoi, Strain GSBS06" /LENGTH=237 /DNA_ID=CAMNT_0051978123 /DNA_START=331 /DNA_END=1044 /DNA_ORIENTATION=+